jgi:hypothetical protein
MSRFAAPILSRATPANLFPASFYLKSRGGKSQQSLIGEKLANLKQQNHIE